MADVLQPQAVTQLGNTLSTIYTVPAAKTAVVTFIRIANATNVAATVRVHVVPNGGTADATNAIMFDFNIPANDFIDFGRGMLLAAQAFIRASANVAATLNIKIDVIESA